MSCARAPAVMIPELTGAFGVDPVGVSAIIGAYYYTYSVASLLAGAALDRFGAKSPIALGAVLLGIGCVVFVVPIPAIGYSGRLLQGLGSAFAFTGAVFLATHGFSGRVLATVVGLYAILRHAGRLRRSGRGGTVDPLAPRLEGFLDRGGFILFCSRGDPVRDDAHGDWRGRQAQEFRGRRSKSSSAILSPIYAGSSPGFCSRRQPSAT